MKAIRVFEYGRPPVLTEMPTPAIADDQVLVRVRSTAVNHLDLVEASGMAREFFPIHLPWVPGHEFSGVIERVGSQVKSFAPGDAVFGNSKAGGAYADYVAAEPALIVKKPAHLSDDEATAVPVAAQTAWQGLFTHGRLAKGQTILIHGGAGGVGAYAVQLAAQAGAQVVATASGDDVEYLKSLGASRIIDYRAAQFEQELPDKVDVVFDLIGGETQQRSFQVLKKGGYLVAANQPVDQEQAAKYGVTGLMMNLEPSAEGKLRADVATVYALEDAPEAWEAMAGGPASATTRRTHGKVVLRVG